MTTAAILRRLARLEAAGDDGFLLFDEERPMPGGLIELHNSRLALDGRPSLVATIPACEVEAFRRRVIRIRPARNYGADGMVLTHARYRRIMRALN